MDKLARFQQAQMTASSGEFLAGIYANGATLADFAESLPANARIVDVGAGLSTLGAEVTAIRDDIEWTNFDINYRPDHPSYKVVDEAAALAAPNLIFRQGDILDLPADMLHSYDVACSYNLVTHYYRLKRSLGNRALMNVVTLAANRESKVIIGPTNGKMVTNKRWNAVTLDARATSEEIKEAQRLLTSPRAANVYYNASQASGIGVYPGARFSPPAKDRLVLSDDGGQTHHRILSKEGLALTARLVGGFFHS
jgi:hypothetical protein